MRIETFEYLRPATLKEACDILAERSGAACILAGGTDLIPRLKQQLVRPSCLLDTTDMAEYRYVRSDAAGLAIGAGTTLQHLTSSETVRQQAPILAEAAGRVASRQIRNVATLGGNLCLQTRCWFYNQSRAWKRAKPDCYKAGGEICYVVNKPGQCYAVFQGDTAPALLALNARVKLLSARGERTLAIDQLYSGNGRDPFTIAPDELLVEVMIPHLPDGSAAAYGKFSHRKAVDFPLAGVAVWLAVDDAQGKGRGARLALTGVGPAPFRVPAAEALLAGPETDAAAIRGAAAAAARAAQPVKNLHHGPPALRRKMVGIMSRRAIEDAGNKSRMK
ncbi:MAG: FAD binding domain-containing protein [Desulfobacterales bacterium]|nr:FAD binding domain-containing protein [Desulfobacterales bacterium]